MSYLLDTNVISELTKQKPQAQVVQWLTTHQASKLYLSVITVGELEQGIRRLPSSQKRVDLTEWFHETLLPRYEDFILPIDRETMLQWGALQADLLNGGRKMPVMDSLIAATALQHGLTLVTRNVVDFVGVGVELVNPWGS